MSEAEIRDCLGDEMALKLSQRLGGRLLYIPLQPNDQNAIRRAIGQKGLTALQDTFRCGALYIPTSIARRWRDKEIIRMTEHGCSSWQIARRFDISTRLVRHIRQLERQYKEVSWWTLKRS